MNLYDDLKAAGVPLDSHESDLYVKATPDARRILAAHGARFTGFISQVDKKLWFDVPVMYEPFWARRVG